MAKNRRKSAAVALAVLGVAGLSLASASTLDLTGGTLQAGVTDLTNCQTAPIAVGFGQPALSGGVYKVSTVTLSSVDAACKGKNVRVTLLNATGGTEGAEATYAIPSAFAGGVVTLSTSASASAVKSAAVVISN